MRWLCRLLEIVNASSHGFRTCPYPAARRRQDRSANSSLCAVPPIVRFAAPAQLTEWIGSEEARRPTCGGKPAQGAIGAVDWKAGGFGEPPSIRTTRNRIIEVRKDHQCFVRGASARQAKQQLRSTRDTPAVSIFSFIVSIHVFI